MRNERGSGLKSPILLILLSWTLVYFKLFQTSLSWSVIKSEDLLYRMGNEGGSGANTIFHLLKCDRSLVWGRR